MEDRVRNLHVEFNLLERFSLSLGCTFFFLVGIDSDLCEGRIRSVESRTV